MANCAKLCLSGDLFFDAYFSAFALALSKTPICADFSLSVTIHEKKIKLVFKDVQELTFLSSML